MPKLVIAGVADCPYFARVELLADRLAANLPRFEVMKIVKMPSEWEDFLKNLCRENLWSHKTSPVVWREPVDFGGMKLLIGGSNEFQEYACCYYGVKSEMTSCMMVNVASDNLRIKKEQEAELEADRLSNRPFKIVITRANSAIAYSVLPSLINGQIFGKDTEVTIYLYDSPEYFQALQGVAMELEDTACAMLRGIKVCEELTEAFVDADFILMLDELRKNPNETRVRWTERKVQHYTNYGHLINEMAKKTVKVVLVVRSNDEFNSTYAASSLLNAAGDIASSRNIIAISAEVYNSVKTIIGERLEVNPSQVQDTIVWGIRRNLDLHLIDCSQAKVFDSRHSAVWAPTEFSLPVRDLVHDDAWLEKELPRLLMHRLREKEDQMRHTAALSISGSIVSCLKHWMAGDGGQRIFTLGVASEGWYNVPYGMFFYIPVRLNSPGLWTPVEELELSDKAKTAIRRIVEHGNEEYYRVEQSEESMPPMEDSNVTMSELSVISKEPELSHKGSPDSEKGYHDFMGLPPSSENLRASRTSTESFQRRRIYPIETQRDPMVEVQFLEYDSVPSNASELVSKKGNSAVSVLDQERLEMVGEAKDLGNSSASLLDHEHAEVVGEVKYLTDEHSQQGY